MIVDEVIIRWIFECTFLKENRQENGYHRRIFFYLFGDLKKIYFNLHYIKYYLNVVHIFIMSIFAPHLIY